jgi:hypothetical protein
MLFVLLNQRYIINLDFANIFKCKPESLTFLTSFAQKRKTKTGAYTRADAPPNSKQPPANPLPPTTRKIR